MRIVDQLVDFDFYHPKEAHSNQSIQQSSFANKNQLQNQSLNRRMVTDSLNKDKQDSINSEGQDETGFHVVIKNFNDINERFRYKPFPQWMINHISDFNRFVYFHDKRTEFHNNYLGIIHKSSIDQVSVVKDYNEIVSHHIKQMHLNYGLNFIQINCCSVSEARKRALLLAYISYDLKQKNFVRMYTQSILGEGIFLKSIFQIWEQHGFQKAEMKIHQLINKGNNNAAEIQTLRDNQRLQTHQGLVLSERDRWSLEGSQQLKFHNVEKFRDMPMRLTTRQRNQELQKVNYLYLQQLNEDSEQTVKLEIDMTSQPEMDQVNTVTHKDQILMPNQSVKHQSQISLGYKGSKGPFKQSFYHISSKEPVSALKNISLNDNKKESVFQKNSNNIQDAFQAPLSTKSGTAWPSSRYDKANNGDGSNTQKYKQNKQGSMINFFSVRNTSNLPSTNLNSNEHTPNTSSIITSINIKQTNAPSIEIPKPGTQPQNFTFNQPNYSAFITRAPSLGNKSISLLVSEQDNQRLLDQNKIQEHVLREQLKYQNQIDKLTKKVEVDKVKQINQIMKQIVRVEQDANIDMYRRFNMQEKELIDQLRDKDRERFEKEQQVRRAQVLHHHNVKRVKQNDREFSNEFNQIRNLISKQSRIGQVMKHKNRIVKEKNEIVKNVRNEEQQVIQNKAIINGARVNNSLKKLKPLISTVFDSSQILEPINKNYQRIPMTAISSPRQKLQPENKGSQHQNSSHDIYQNYFYQGKQINPQSTQNVNQKKRVKLLSQSQVQNKEFDHMENQLYEFGMRETAKNSSIKFRQGHKITFIEENYPINLSNQSMQVVQIMPQRFDALNNSIL